MDSSVELGRRVSGRAESRLLIDGELVAALSGNEKTGATMAAQ